MIKDSKDVKLFLKHNKNSIKKSAFVKKADFY